jgi:hypothetical protein
MARMFEHRHYEKIAELIGKAKDLDEFYRLFVQFAKSEAYGFNVERFYNAVQKSHQFGGIGTGYEGVHIRGQ